VRRFDACSSSIEQRPCEIRPGSAPPAHDIPYETRSPHWPWGQPGRYYGRAGDRNRRGPHHGRCRPRQICFAPRAGWLSVPVRQHPREVSSLSRGVISPPLSGPLQTGLRFLPRPLPAAPSARLAAGLPLREDDGLTTLHRKNPRGLGPVLTPVALHLRRMTLQHPDLATYPFGPSLSAPLACLCLRRLRRFTWVGRTTRPWPPTAAVLAVAISARALIATLAGEDPLSRGLRTPPLPATHAPVGDCWQNSRCRHLLREEQHTSRDTLVSHALEQETGISPHGEDRGRSLAREVIDSAACRLVLDPRLMPRILLGLTEQVQIPASMGPRP
jgi:hypothetical protein